MDKFYTKPEISQQCINILSKYFDWSKWSLVVEPSAGNGSFSSKIPISNSIAMDILPENSGILKQDFLTYYPTTTGEILVIGNPPFGRVSSMAVKFFNHASKWCSVIAFILPRTFRRLSIQSKLNKNFHLLHDNDIPVKPCAFEPAMMAKCCFQVWIKKDTLRYDEKLAISHPDWDFLKFGPLDIRNQPTPPENADFALRAYGGNCGEIIIENLELLRPKSWHWIRSNIDKNTLMERFLLLNYNISQDTARQNSIGKKELVKLYSEKYD